MAINPYSTEKASPYAQDKAANFPLHIIDLREGRQPYPVHVQLIISDLCSQNCSFCAYRQDGNGSNQLFGVPKADGTKNNNPNRKIPTAKIMEILDDCQAMNVKAVQLTGGGEPTIHPDFKLVAKSVIDRGMELALVTNGVHLDEDATEILMNAAWLRISIDAGTSQSYQRIRRVSQDHWNRAWANIRVLAQRKKEAGSKVYIGVGFVVMKENWKEVCQAAMLARDAGADSFRISAAFLKEGKSYFDGFGEQADELCRKATELATPSFEVVNYFPLRLSDLLGPPDYHFCGYQHFTTYIGGDLNVYRCCNNAYNTRGYIGSLADQSFKSLWDSQAKKDDFAAFDASGCERCQFNGHNKAIARFIAKPESHECFV